MNVRNTPLPASWLKNATPAPFPPSGCGAAAFSPIPMISGNNVTTASSSWLRRRKNTSLSSLRKNLRFPRTYAAVSLTSAASLAAGTASSALDIEALSGQADEQVLQARGLHGQAADADPGVHQLGADAFRLGVAELGGDHVLPRHRVGEAELAEHLGRRHHVGGVHRDPRGGGAAQLGERSLEDQPAG